MAREDLNPVEEARACAALVEELGLTREEVGLRVGRSRVAVSNLMRLLDLPDEALELLERGDAHRGPRPRAAARRPTTPTAAASRAPPPRRAGRCARSRRAPATRTPRRRRPRAAGAPRGCTPTSAAAAAQIAEALGGALGAEVRVTPRGGGYRVELPFDDPTRPSPSPAACARARRLSRAPAAKLPPAVRAISSVG